MAEDNANSKFTAFLGSLPPEDREWFEERLAIIQFSGETELPELDAARIAYQTFQKTKRERIVA